MTRRPKHRGYQTCRIGAQIARTKGAAYRRGQLWFALRVLRNCTALELMAVAEQDKKHNVLVFLGQLRKAGFVRAQYGNRGRHEPTHYFLIRDTGPKCPSVLKRGTVVYDQNTHQEHPIHVTQ